MFKSLLVAGWRQFRRDRFHAILNISGLAIGIAGFLVAMLWVQDELSYDEFHEKKDRLYRVMENQFYADGNIFTTTQTPHALGAVLKSDFPEFEEVVQVAPRWGKSVIQNGDKVFFEEFGLFASTTFFNVFSYPLIAGSGASALQEASSIVISEDLARKYFNTTDVLGKSLIYNGNEPLTITGVMKNPPRQSHFNFQFVIPFEYQRRNKPKQFDSWNSNWMRTYVLLKDGVNAKNVDPKIEGVILANNKDSKTELFLHRLTDIYLHYNFNNATGRFQYVLIFGVIGIFVLVIACINFTNLMTARFLKRAREVGLRKMSGAGRGHVAVQILSETAFMCLAAGVLAMLIGEIVLPSINLIADKQLQFHYLDSLFISMFLGSIAFVVFLAGIYPAVFYSRIEPITILKGSFQFSGSGSTIRRTLVVTQFTLSVVLIVCTVMIYRQLTYMQSKDLGYDTSALLSFDIRKPMDQKWAAAKEELSKISGIESVTASDMPVMNFGNSTGGVKWPGQKSDQEILFTNTAIDMNYFETLKLKMMEGRVFDAPTDSNTVIFNETAIKAMGLISPIGQIVKIHGSPATIIGVVKDFHFNSLHQPITPLFLFNDLKSISTGIVRVQTGELSNTIASIQKVCEKLSPAFPFDFYFVDERLENSYRTEIRLSKLVSIFSGLAIFISCLGLIGLASFTVEQRTKEIGVRKVLGASMFKIQVRLASEFFKPVLIANAIAIPLSYFIVNRWLENFAYRTDISPGVFVVAVCFTILVALATVSYHTLRAALADPIKALKYE